MNVIVRRQITWSLRYQFVLFLFVFFGGGRVFASLLTFYDPKLFRCSILIYTFHRVRWIWIWRHLILFWNFSMKSVWEALNDWPHSSGHVLFQSQKEITRRMCEIYSKLRIKTPERIQWQCLHSMLTLNRFNRFFCLSIVDFEEVKVNWDFSR